MSQVETAPHQDISHGRHAEAPHDIPMPGLKDVLWRVYVSFTEDRVMLVAGGVTFYLLLALFPAMTALVSLYGFVADPVAIADRIGFLREVMPADGLEIFVKQLMALATEERGTLSVGLMTGLALALWSANAGIKALFEAMNIAYGEDEKRSFLWLNFISLIFTFAALLAAILLLVGLGVIPAMIALLSPTDNGAKLIGLLRWPVLLVLVAGGISLLYRFGPSREPAKLRWITWGAGVASLLWLLGSLGVSFYLLHVANFNATYGTLGALIGFLFWTWISTIVVILGAELNAELEHQTAKDTTTGPPKPMGQRGAYMADTLGEIAE
ncbi:YihY/virulence factor BrkB family protein [Rhizobium oryzicola]|uniref:YihY/virulence factor BrkB family protein n=1 Tax=Rhizobium oryzicola TaxID=1232668 RepID=A0ABT8ST46_9HYPH|nr:YihY/virulence factor BrkB family protein [Rhizobium oryzicola]MDO1581420.1 YihY/virulence factor BrkB family protein [Rhizobium oryzicola]